MKAGGKGISLAGQHHSRNPVNQWGFALYVRPVLACTGALLISCDTKMQQLLSTLPGRIAPACWLTVQQPVPFRPTTVGLPPN